MNDFETFKVMLDRAGLKYLAVTGLARHSLSLWGGYFQHEAHIDFWFDDNGQLIGYEFNEASQQPRFACHPARG